MEYKEQEKPKRMREKKEYNNAEIAERIRTKRKEEGYSNQEALIEALSDKGVRVGRNTISNIENGNFSNCSLNLLIAICEILKCNIGYIVGEYDYSTTETADICEVTGLNEKSIENFKEISKENESTRIVINRFVDLLTDWVLLPELAVRLNDYISQRDNDETYSIVDNSGNFIGLFSNDVRRQMLLDSFGRFLSFAEQTEQPGYLSRSMIRATQSKLPPDEKAALKQQAMEDLERGK